MSHLLITGQSTTWSMNVLGFSSPVYGQINTAQTHTLAVHFPIKLSQPALQMDLVFRGEPEFEAFQRFVRNHQQQLSQDSSALLTFNWPERSINNFTGYITSCKAGGQRANYAPHLRIVVELVNSFVTQRTDYASFAANWRSIYGGFGSANGVLAMPTAAEQQQNIINLGQSLITGQFVSVVGGSPNGVSGNMLNGILAGTG